MQAKRLLKVPGYVLLAGVLGIGSAVAAPAVSERDAPVQLAALSAPSTGSAKDAVVYPAHEAGVRAAAAAGPDALRWYVQRTRMIHHFYYYDFAKDLPG